MKKNNTQQTPNIDELLKIVRTAPDADTELNKILKQYPKLDKVYVRALKIAANYNLLINKHR